MIDFSVISEFEGRSLVGYVPNAGGSKSGVTVASGFDIGQRSPSEIPRQVRGKLSPYCGRTEFDAVAFLRDHPLTITTDECDLINKFAHKEAAERLISAWNKESFTPFSMLPNEAQTVVASVAFQYGSLEKATPNFWRQTTSGDWVGALANLRDFGDSYKTRRNKEADLLESRFYEDKTNA